MQLLLYIWIGILSLIGAGTLWMVVAGVRDHFRCERYKLEKENAKEAT